VVGCGGAGAGDRRQLGVLRAAFHAGQAGQGPEDISEVLDGLPVFGALLPAFGHRCFRGADTADRGWSIGHSRLAIHVGVHQGRQGLPHVPFHVVGQHADECVSSDSIREPMVDGSDWGSRVLRHRKAVSTSERLW